MRALVIGAAGYAGGELLKLLSVHPQVTLLRALSRSSAGRPFAQLHPALAGLSAGRFEDAAPAEAAASSDVVFLALEHGASSRLAGELLEATPGPVLDIAADFRLRDPERHARFYGAHPAPQAAQQFVYALADVAATELRGCRALAIPGCFATAAALASRPLALGCPTATATAFAVTGSSGAGAAAKETTHHPVRATNLQAYQVLSHRHQAELDQCWSEWTGSTLPAPRLLTHSGPFVRGIALTLHARGRFDQDGATLLARTFEGRPFVRCLDAPPALNHVVGTNLALMHAVTNHDRSELVVHVAIDNLIKGAAGQAVQAMNLALGFEETLGLRLAGGFPC